MKNTFSIKLIMTLLGIQSLLSVSCGAQQFFYSDSILPSEEIMRFGDLAVRYLPKNYKVNDSIIIHDSLYRLNFLDSGLIGVRYLCPDSLFHWRLKERSTPFAFTDHLWLPGWDNLELTFEYAQDSSLMRSFINQYDPINKFTDEYSSMFFAPGCKMRPGIECRHKVGDRYISFKLDENNLLSEVSIYIAEGPGSGGVRYVFNSNGSCIKYGALYNEHPIGKWLIFYDSGLLQRVERHELIRDEKGKLRIDMTVESEYQDLQQN